MRTTPRSHSWFVLVGFILVSIVVGAARVDGASVTLSWTAPTTNADGTRLADLASYRIYLATSTPPCPSASFFTVPSPTRAPASGQTMSSLVTALTPGTTYFARVTAVDNSGNESACSGAASGVAHPDFRVTPSTTSFGSVPIGSTVDRTFTVQNTSTMTLSGAASVGAPYSTLSGGSFSLAPGASQTVTIRFRPTTTGTFIGNVNFTAGVDAVSRGVSGSGTIIAPVTLSVTKSGSGSGTVTSTPDGINCGRACSLSVTRGRAVTLTARAAAGSGFTGWRGACAGTADCVVTMSAARAVTATFAKFRLTVATAGVGAGIVRGPGLACVRPAVVGNECTETYAPGAVVTLTARAAAGSGFTGWGGACAGAGTADCVVTMSAARAVTATFAKFRLTVATAGVGAGVVGGPGLTCVRPAVVGNECTETYAAGAIVTLTARAAAGSGFTGWGGACAGAGTADCVVTMSAARAVTATFAKFRLTVAGAE